jgi:hypothetical protein
MLEKPLERFYDPTTVGAVYVVFYLATLLVAVDS